MRQTLLGVISAALIAASAAIASAPPVGALPKGSVSTIVTTKGQLVSIALPSSAASTGLVWRLARPLSAKVAVEVGEADVGKNVVVIFRATGVGTASIVYALTKGESPKAQQAKTFKLRVTAA